MRYPLFHRGPGLRLLSVGRIAAPIRSRLRGRLVAEVAAALATLFMTAGTAPAAATTTADTTSVEARAAAREAPKVLSRELQSGEALIWYLYHSGWAVKTRNNFLVFDYAGPPSSASPARGASDCSLDSGCLDPAGIAGENVTVFVSHRHGDHYDSRILEWRPIIEKIRYVWGWEEAGSPEDLRFGRERRKVAAGGLEILNVHHEFDGIPESAFLVNVDGLSLLHSGDHARGMDNPVFKENILYLAREYPRLDVFFVPMFGEAMEAIRAIQPRAVFPMHAGGREGRYLQFAIRMKALGLEAEAGAAGKPGDVFLYSDGKITPYRP